MSGAGNTKKNKGTDGGITERKQARTTKQAAENAAAATIADRLTNRAKTQIVNVTMQDEAGNFNIPMQVPSVGVTYELAQFEELMKDEDGRVKMATMMADLSTDPSMDYDFWYSGTIGLVDLRLLIEGLTTAALKRMEEVRSFRAK
jgi:hypothetical protein